ncbi:MAG TPA: glucosaminidase domain-containing protein [Saprospiraceae bacterium]|nr:glucosaminidase domain-containing protein [Saprospiraceae bacterium]HRG21643.1 glucosaminidase domain-containing protein [Saprospiraceae bacterium]HRG64501.1 glucosaminidase domain-containing protein [Saprospiraceae bacterium]
MSSLFRLTVFSVMCFSLFSFSRTAEEDAAYSYIDQFKELAVVEMHRSGIPASIILAQALHESQYGMSRLATEANNHFGIKCKSYWVGKTYYHKDDDFNRDGQLIESCFRSYGSALESYVDHSNFLMSTVHYLPLFNYEHTDYKSWASGLKSCGYATDQKYAQKLITKIEKYELNKFDAWENPYKLILGQ